MRRAQHLGRREDQRIMSSAHGRSHFVVYSTQPSAPPSTSGGGSEPAASPVGNPSTPVTFDGNEQSSPQQIPQFQTWSSSLTPLSTAAETNPQGIHSDDRYLDLTIYSLMIITSVWVYIVYLLACRRFASHSLPASQDRAQPSEQSFSDSLRSRFNAVSMRYDFLETMCLQTLYAVKVDSSGITSSCGKGTKNRFRRARGDGRRGCSLLIHLCQNLVQKLRENWMPKLLVCRDWWSALKQQEKIIGLQALLYHIIWRTIPLQRQAIKTMWKLMERTLRVTIILHLLVLLAQIQNEL